MTSIIIASATLGDDAYTEKSTPNQVLRQLRFVFEWNIELRFKIRS